MQTIRKSIYIGLGGTGVKAIAQTKRMFEETFGMGNIPPQVTFLALDYDRSAIDECGLATDISSDFVIASSISYGAFWIGGTYPSLFPHDAI